MENSKHKLSLDAHGDKWHQWIIDNLKRNCSPASMLDQMIGGVWDRSLAIKALNEGLDILGMDQQWLTPLPMIKQQCHIVNGDNEPIRVLCQFEKPHAVLLDGLLSASECNELIQYAYSKGLKRSGVVSDDNSGVSIEHHARTSTSVFFTRSETPLINKVEQRLADLTGWPIENGEGLQILQYEPGQEYKAHYDWFNPKNEGGTAHLKRGGQRVGTTVMYLRAADEGGSTRFPKHAVEVSPNAGGAIFFTNLNTLGEPDKSSLHAGTPVVKGTKIVMTYWQREASFR